MNTFKLFFPLMMFATLLFSGCTTDLTKAQAFSPEDFAKEISDRTVADEAVYLGSDSKYHYFGWSELLHAEHLYKIARVELDLTGEYKALDKRSSFKFGFNDATQRWECRVAAN